MNAFPPSPPVKLLHHLSYQTIRNRLGWEYISINIFLNGFVPWFSSRSTFFRIKKSFKNITNKPPPCTSLMICTICNNIKERFNTNCAADSIYEKSMEDDLSKCMPSSLPDGIVKVSGLLPASYGFQTMTCSQFRHIYSQKGFLLETRVIILPTQQKLTYYYKWIESGNFCRCVQKTMNSVSLTILRCISRMAKAAKKLAYW